MQQKGGKSGPVADLEEEKKLKSKVTRAFP